MNWKNKVVIVTGAARGIGKALATEICKRGGKVLLNDINETALMETSHTLLQMNYPVAFKSGDICVETDCQAVVDHTVDTFGRLDVLINNAGAFADEATLEEINYATFKKVVEVNLVGAVFMTKAALPILRCTHGSVLFLGSVAGMHGLGGHAAYSSSKMALTGVYQSLRKELHRTGVHVGIAYLGFVENDPKKTVFSKDGKSIPIAKRNVGKTVPLEVAVNNILKLVEERKTKRAFTLLGKISSIVNRISPYVAHWVLLMAYKRSREGV